MESLRVKSTKDTLVSTLQPHKGDQLSWARPELRPFPGHETCSFKTRHTRTRELSIIFRDETIKCCNDKRGQELCPFRNIYYEENSDVTVIWLGLKIIVEYVSKQVEIYTLSFHQLILGKVRLTSKPHLEPITTLFPPLCSLKSGRKAQIYHPGWYFPRAPRSHLWSISLISSYSSITTFWKLNKSFSLDLRILTNLSFLMWHQ